MNQYARLARRYFQQRLPRQASSMTSLNYQQLGETIAQQIDELALTLEGADDPTETHLQKVGRLTAARRRAAETVLQAWIYDHPAETEVVEAETAADTNPEMDAIWQSAADLRALLDQDDDPN